MSEYIEIETSFTDNPDIVHISTNLTLAEHGEEYYPTEEDMEMGSPLAQSLSLVDGIMQLRIHGNSMEITRNPGDDWHHIVPDIKAALKDFYL